MEVVIENIRRLRNFSASFTPGINIVVGPNGSGKTTLIGSIFLAFYGRTLWGSRNHREIVTFGESYGLCDVTLPIEGKEIRVIRVFGKGSSVKVYVDNELKDISPESLIPPDKLSLVYLRDTKIDVFSYYNIEERLAPVRKYQASVIEEKSRLEKDIAAVMGRKEEIKKMLQDIQKELENSKRARRDLESKLVDLKSKLRVSDRSELERLEQLLNKAKVEVETQLAQKELLKKESSVLLERIRLLQSKLNEIELKSFEDPELRSLDEQRKLIARALEMRLGICPVCGSNVHEQTLRDRFDRLSSELEKACSILESKKTELREHLLEEIRLLEENRSEIERKLEVDRNEIIKRVKLSVLGPDLLWVTTQNLQEQRVLLDEIERCIRLIGVEQEREEKIAQKEELLQSRIREADEELNELLKQKEEREKLLVVLEKLKTREVKRHIGQRIVNVLSSIAGRYSFNVKVLPSLRESSDGPMVEFTAINLHGDVVRLEELSGGEKVLSKIIMNLILRDFLELVPSHSENLPKLLIIDEHLDKLDKEQFEMLLETIQSTNWTFIVVTHREELVEDSRYNVIYMQ